MADSKTIGDAANRLVDGVEALAKAAEKVAPEAWEVAVSAHRTEALTQLVAWLAFAALLVFIGRLAIIAGRKSGDSYEVMPPDVVLGAGWLMVGIAGIVTTATLADNLPRAINPEWYAAQSIMYAVVR